MKRILIILNSALIFLAFLGTSELLACTSAIVTGKVTPDGRPLLWKHRDTGEEQNRIDYFSFGKYRFLALVNSPDPQGEAWAGTNEAGFSIMNTASYNLKDKDDSTKDKDKEGVLMFKALAICATLADFERFLDTLSRPMGVEANFGVIDAHGGAAYYEVNNFSYTKLDVNDPAIAPQGYFIVTNFSYTGRFNEGMGYIRQQNALELFGRMAPTRGITPLWIAQGVSRSFYHSLLGIDLTKSAEVLEMGNGWFIDQDFIPRKSTSASVIMQGVKPGEDPQMTIMWTLLGYPPATVMLPLWVAAGDRQPALLMRTAQSQNAPLCEWAVALKHQSFSIERGNGSRYFYWRGIYNPQGTGYMQRLLPIEDKIYGYFLPKIEQWRKSDKIDLRALDQSYAEVSHWIRDGYTPILSTSR
ncbi:MAG: hypothetical protein FWE30_06710 [Bacteroidales bacterium]|nr:hypothetical protein [Bacteroidales bacterium]